MANSTNTGKVKFFNDSKGYGFVTDDASGQEYFFHFTAVLDKVKKDDLVSFDLKDGDKGLKAINVKKV